MKTTSNLWINILALVIGILLLIFAEQSTLFTSIVCIIGILFIIACAIALITAFLPPKDALGIRHINWFMVVAGAVGLAFGICLVAVPDFFASAIIYTFGVIMILAGVMAFAYLINNRDFMDGSWGLYIIPSLVIITGIIVIILGSPHLLNTAAAIITGIALVIYAANGFLGLLKYRSHSKRLIGNQAPEVVKSIDEIKNQN